jgi:hypothetical protein
MQKHFAPTVPWWLVVLLLCLVAACSKPAAEVTPTASEPSFAEQAVAVRDGQTDMIRLDHTEVRDDNLKMLAGLDDQLRRLNLSKTTVTDAGLATVCKMRRLEQLRIASKELTDAGVPELAQLEDLKHLHLIDAPLSDAGLAHLEKLTWLKSLYLDGIQASDEAIEKLIKALPDVHLHFDGGHHRHDAGADEHP